MSKLPVVVHLLPNYNAFPPVIPAGTELRVEQVSLRQKRYSPVVICGAFNGQPEKESIGKMQIRRIKFGRLYRRIFQKITRLDPVPYAQRIWRIVRSETAAIIHIHNEPKLLTGLSSYLRLEPIPVVVHIANQKPFRAEDLPLVTLFIACSHFMAEWLAKTYGVPREKIKVVYTGVDTQARLPPWALPEGHRDALRRRLGLGKATVVFLFGGRLVQEKGVSEMLDAFELLRNRVEFPVALLIAGNVREGTDPRNVKARYGKEMVKKIASMPDVRWVGSLLPSEMHDFLLTGDIFLLPSLWDDPFPTVMLEAAAAGLPIVAAARGGITEFLKDCPELAFVGNLEDPESLATSMEYLAQSPSRCNQAGRWLRDTIEQQYDWSRVARDFEEIYDEILSLKLSKD